MGSPGTEYGRSLNEGPERQIFIDTDFAVNKYEVTVEQFRTLVADSGYNSGNRCWTFEQKKFQLKSERSFANPGYEQSNNHPAASISWKHAKAHVSWIGGKTGRSYRLLSEVEWEYSARAGTNTPYYFGDRTNELCRYYNHGARLTSFNSRNRS